MLTIPPIDLTAARRDPQSRSAQIELLDTACSRIGYGFVTGHGIPTALLVELYEVSRQFFLLPDDEKCKVAQPAPEQVRGWSGTGSEGMSYSLDEESHGDLKEKMDIGPVTGATVGEPGAEPLSYPNLWPAYPARFRSVWEQYYTHMQRVGAELLSLAAEGFDLPGDYFEPLFDRELSMLRGLYFPPQLERPVVHQSRAGIHTDYGAFTVISAESSPAGLEVLDADGEWVEVATTPSTLVVLVGDLLAEWTGDHWPVSLHRTANPPRSIAVDDSRSSFAFYQHPNFDVPVTELPPFVPSSRVGRPDPLIAGAHLTEKYLRQTTFGRRPSAEK
ncbi:isopenicillin N synthase-like dioxygenase [Rhodococcus sp. 27YEA15]|uniref:isopenicillin N synthase family dioxygenase n=1 Tax=Rhodococcus sp. 27YEA15 TaxID=3156259 RepID=UPI003C7C6AA2